MGGTAGPSTSLANLRVAGAWSGIVEVSLDEWTVKDLRAEVSRRSGFSLSSINLISAGKILKDHVQGASSPSLKGAGLGEKSKILVTRVGGEEAKLLDEERERSERISRITAAADAMAKRSDESGFPTDDFDIQLENQSGDKLSLSEGDRRELTRGLILHSKARNLIQRDQYAEALEVLAEAEESFSRTDRQILEAVDNVALLQLDTVWCLFMLRDIARLAIARERLLMAREGLSRSHGSNLERLRVLQGGFCPELAIYVRLELLEGVVAYHSGQSEPAVQSLISARAKYQQLQVSDDALAQLAAMGFATAESRRALRLSGQDVHRAVEFTMEERRKKQEKGDEDRKRRRDRREQKKFGRTPSGRAVDMTKLKELVSIGYDRAVAAEALRRYENDIQRALDDLTNPELFASLRAFVQDSQSKKRVDDTSLAVLLSMGFDHDTATRALQASDSQTEAVDRLLRGEFLQGDATQLPLAASSSSSAVRRGSSLDSSVESSGSTTREPSNFGDGELTPPVIPEVRDEEMEDDIAANLTGDALAEYDLEVDKEGAAIAEYLQLVQGTNVERS